MFDSIPDVFKTTPIVYAAGRDYQIFVPVRSQTVMWVKVGEHEFFDDSNGILRSSVTLHKITVPASLLDKEKKYTVCWREVYERKAYFSDVGEIHSYESEFKPVSGDKINIYHIADAHNCVEGPVNAAGFFGDTPDLLVLNGDIPNHSGKIEYFDTIHKIASEVTHGKSPVIFSRGNHDTRGIYAESIADYTPVVNGNSFYTVHIGNLWILVLDCGEDKSDDDEEYAHTVCCENFRRRETAFIEDVIRRSDEEYLSPEVKHRFVIVHVPFTHRYKGKFGIESELYQKWSKLLREQIKPQMMLCGHLHKCFVSRVGSDFDDYGQPCPVVVASKIDKNDPTFSVGGAITVTDKNINIKFTDNNHTILGEDDIVIEDEN